MLLNWLLLSQMNLKHILRNKGYLKMAYISRVNNMEIKKDKLMTVWSENTHRLDRIVDDPGNCVLYYLQSGPKKAFLHEELMHIPQVRPEWVNKRKRRTMFSKVFSVPRAKLQTIKNFLTHLRLQNAHAAAPAHAELQSNCAPADHCCSLRSRNAMGPGNDLQSHIVIKLYK